MKTYRSMGFTALIVFVLGVGSAWAQIPGAGDYDNHVPDPIETDVNWGSQSFIGDNGTGNIQTVQTTGGNLTVSGNLFVGRNGTNNTLNVYTGARVDITGYLEVGNGTSADNNSVTVDNSTLTSTSYIRVARSGSGNTLTVTNGANVSADTNLHIGWGVGSDDNSVTVTNSTIAIGNSTYIGNNGSDSSLTLTNATMTSEGNLFYVGLNGANASLDISGGTQLTTNGEFYLGRNAGADDCTVTVSGTGTKLMINNYMAMGGAGNRSILTVENGGEVEMTGSFAPGRFGGEDHQVYVTNGTLKARNTWIGRESANTTTEVTEGGSLTTQELWLGSNSTGGHVLTVSGSNSSLTVTSDSEGYDGDLIIGRLSAASDNAMSVLNNATVDVGNMLVVGDAGSNNTLTVNNATMHVGTDAEADDRELFIGQSGGSNKMYVHAGGNVTIAGPTRIGNSTSANENLLEISGAGSEFATTWMHVGAEGGDDNIMRILAGGQAHTSGVLYVGRIATSNNNLLQISGEGSILTNTSTTGIRVNFRGDEGAEGNRLWVEDKGVLEARVIEIYQGGTFDVDGATVALADTLVIESDATLNFNESGSLIHIGAGYDTVTNDYSGNVLHVADGGTLTANGDLNLTTAGYLETVGVVFVEAGGTVQGAGTIDADADVSGALRPGNSAGTLTFTGELTLREGSSVYIELGDGENDLVIADSILVEGGTLYFSLIEGYTPVYEERFQIFDLNGEGDVLSGVSFEGYDYTGLPSGWSVDDTDLYTLGQITIIPEPHTMGLILLGLGAVALRRRFAGK